MVRDRIVLETIGADFVAPHPRADLFCSRRIGRGMIAGRFGSVECFDQPRLGIFDVLLFDAPFGLLRESSGKMSHADADRVLVAMLATTTRATEQGIVEVFGVAKIIGAGLIPSAFLNDRNRDCGSVDAGFLTRAAQLLPAVTASFVICYFSDIRCALNNRVSIDGLDGMQSIVGGEILAVGLCEIIHDSLCVIAAFGSANFYFHFMGPY
jgi:hypothetical protein